MGVVTVSGNQWQQVVPQLIEKNFLLFTTTISKDHQPAHPFSFLDGAYDG